ncbi:LysR family transcriptional regulator substrate-binding protein [Mesorhizobium sp. L2C066B000]|uniref:LysR family transcriptional regulator substrate-binding protein n=1 Tax=Mesorhizobium sp. L2C066B000 TaxID=1287105 RepID=UPI000B0A137B|nr:LysR family transcriptional regulator substrate-binding protein [Mesorhizobium sp. L2C066B000]
MDRSRTAKVQPSGFSLATLGVCAAVVKRAELAISVRLGSVRLRAAFPSFFKEQLGVLIPLKRRCPVLLRDVPGSAGSVDLRDEEPGKAADRDCRAFRFRFVTLPKVVAIIHSKTASNVRSISESYEQIGEHILAGRADLGISRLPLNASLFEWVPLGSARNVCILHPDHRFSKRTCIEAQDLAGETIVDIDPQFAAHQMNFNALRFAGVEPDILVEFDCNGHEAGYVSAGLGISITNEIIAREYAAFNLGIKPVEPSALYHYVAIWQKGRTFSSALNVSLEAIIAAFSTEPPAVSLGSANLLAVG